MKYLSSRGVSPVRLFSRTGDMFAIASSPLYLLGSARNVTVCTETAANSSIMVIKSKRFFIAMKLDDKDTKNTFLS